ncbi:unnamed protein product [Sphagnum jensenii]|uniref:Uncharacterized protein n=1 Tax=Sphagnum jensenii TaxID=128206 RepID=A0ABP1C0F2_9BRYO
MQRMRRATERKQKLDILDTHATQLDHDRRRIRAENEHQCSHKMLVHSGNLLRIGIAITSIGTNNVADKARCKLPDLFQEKRHWPASHQVNDLLALNVCGVVQGQANHDELLQVTHDLDHDVRVLQAQQVAADHFC